MYVRKRGNFLAPLKTESSKRYIIIDDYLLSELKRWQEYLIEREKELDGYVYIYVEPDGLLTRKSKIFPAFGFSLKCCRQMFNADKSQTKRLKICVGIS